MYFLATLLGADGNLTLFLAKEPIKDFLIFFLVGFLNLASAFQIANVSLNFPFMCFSLFPN